MSMEKMSEDLYSRLASGFFLSSMMAVTDGAFCAERNAGCAMVQLGAYLAEPTADKEAKGANTQSFLPPDWDACTQFLAQECQSAHSVSNVFTCLNLATPRLEWGLKAAQSFLQASGDFRTQRSRRVPALPGPGKVAGHDSAAEPARAIQMEATAI